jgi:hypothetical protein
VHKRDATTRLARQLKKIHPLGKSPVITDGALTVAGRARSSVPDEDHGKENSGRQTAHRTGRAHVDALCGRLGDAAVHAGALRGDVGGGAPEARQDRQPFGLHGRNVASTTLFAGTDFRYPDVK